MKENVNGCFFLNTVYIALLVNLRSTYLLYLYN